MKRTLTAAATLVAGSAGAIGFAGTASAADSPELPAELPVDNGVANTAYHGAATLHSAQSVVGDVVPANEEITGRSGGTALPTDGAPVDVSPGTNAAGNLLDKAPVDKVGSEVLGSATGRSASPDGGDGSGGGPLSGVTGALPGGNALSSLTGGGALDGVTGSLPIG